MIILNSRIRKHQVATSTTKNLSLFWQRVNQEYRFQKAFDHYTVNMFFTSPDLAGIEGWVFKKNQAIFWALSDVFMSCNSSQESVLTVAELWTIDFKRLLIEHDLFLSFRVNYPNKKLDDCMILSCHVRVLAKLLNVHLRTKWLWVRISLQSRNSIFYELYQTRCDVLKCIHDNYQFNFCCI